MKASVALSAFCIWAFFFWSVLPRGETFAVGQPAPDFTLSDHTGAQVHLAAELQRGPVLLVFYRGSW